MTPVPDIDDDTIMEESPTRHGQSMGDARRNLEENDMEDVNDIDEAIINIDDVPKKDASAGTSGRVPTFDFRERHLD